TVTLTVPSGIDQVPSGRSSTLSISPGGIRRASSSAWNAGQFSGRSPYVIFSTPAGSCNVRRRQYNAASSSLSGQFLGRLVGLVASAAYSLRGGPSVLCLR